MLGENPTLSSTCVFHVIVTSCYDHDLDRTVRSATEREGRGDAGDDVTGITARTAFASSSQHSRSLRATPVTGETADDLDCRERGVGGHLPPSCVHPPPPPACFILKSYFILQQLFVFLFDVLSVAVYVIRDRFVKPTCA